MSGKEKIGSNDELRQNPLGIPRDAAKGDTILTMTGRLAVHVENYRNILVYSETKVRIQAKKYKLTVSGRNLCIRYYDKDEMVVTGFLESLSFE